MLVNGKNNGRKTYVVIYDHISQLKVKLNIKENLK